MHHTQFKRKPSECASWHCEPTQGNRYWHRITWTPGHLFLTGDLPTMVVTDHEHLKDLEDGMMWAGMSKPNEILAKTDEPKTFDLETTLDRIFEHAWDRFEQGDKAPIRCLYEALDGWVIKHLPGLESKNREPRDHFTLIETDWPLLHHWAHVRQACDWRIFPEHEGRLMRVLLDHKFTETEKLFAYTWSRDQMYRADLIKSWAMRSLVPMSEE